MICLRRVVCRVRQYGRYPAHADGFVTRCAHMSFWSVPNLEATGQWRKPACALTCDIRTPPGHGGNHIISWCVVNRLLASSTPPTSDWACVVQPPKVLGGSRHAPAPRHWKGRVHTMHGRDEASRRFCHAKPIKVGVPRAMRDAGWNPCEIDSIARALGGASGNQDISTAPRLSDGVPNRRRPVSRRNRLMDWQRRIGIDVEGEKTFPSRPRLDGQQACAMSASSMCESSTAANTPLPVLDQARAHQIRDRCERRTASDSACTPHRSGSQRRRIRRRWSGKAVDAYLRASIDAVTSWRPVWIVGATPVVAPARTSA